MYVPLRLMFGTRWHPFLLTSPTHLSQQILHMFHKVNKDDVFVVKRKKLMDPIEDGIYQGEGTNDYLFARSVKDQGGSHKSVKGPVEDMIHHFYEFRHHFYISIPLFFVSNKFVFVF